MRRLLCLIGIHRRVNIPRDDLLVSHEYACRHCRRMWSWVSLGMASGWVRTDG